MNRRTFLEGLSRSLALLWTGVLVVPGVRYVMASIRREESTGATARRVARLADLPVGRPVSVAITGSRQDAWTTYPDQPLGQIWLIRRDSESSDPTDVQIDAYSSICPHLKCQVQLAASQKTFVCPCHRGAFDLEGRPLSKAQLGHDNPVPGPLESYAVHVVEDDQQELWVEVDYDA